MVACDSAAEWCGETVAWRRAAKSSETRIALSSATSQIAAPSHARISSLRLVLPFSGRSARAHVVLFQGDDLACSASDRGATERSPGSLRWQSQIRQVAFTTGIRLERGATLCMMTPFSGRGCDPAIQQRLLRSEPSEELPRSPRPSSGSERTAERRPT